ncbi:hypothetical protein A1356_17085 [Methylomonas koyamae]|uniref:Uncharacterized protein n=1 Tax=Methylomonas koyamae TaxID=702114 RepID=A0AA91DAM7_9GAMM|nr:hypothetical protein A1356_17085 [Methylomonas koyamae]
MEFNGGFSAINLKSGRSPADPFLPVAFLHTGQSDISRFHKLEVYKAAIEGLANRPIDDILMNCF